MKKYQARIMWDQIEWEALQHRWRNDPAQFVAGVSEQVADRFHRERHAFWESAEGQAILANADEDED